MVTRSENRIKFSYATSGLWEEIKTNTAFKAKFSFKDPMQIDNAAMNDSDEIFFKNHLPSAIKQPHAIMHKLMHGIDYEDTILVDEYPADSTSGGGTGGSTDPVGIPKQCRITIKDNNQYTQGTLIGIDDLIKSMIITFITIEWYKNLALQDLKIEIQTYEVMKMQLKNLLTNLFRKQIA